MRGLSCSSGLGAGVEVSLTKKSVLSRPPSSENLCYGPVPGLDFALGPDPGPTAFYRVHAD